MCEIWTGGFWLPVLLRLHFLLGSALGPAGHGEELQQTVVDNLRSGNQRESHAEAQQTSGIGDVRDPGDLLVFQELLHVGILDEGVKQDQVVFGVLKDLLGEVAQQFPRSIRTKVLVT